MVCFLIVTFQVLSNLTSSVKYVPLMTIGGFDNDPFKDLFIDEATRPSFPNNNDLFMSFGKNTMKGATKGIRCQILS